MLDNPTFYPTPEALIDKMIEKIQVYPKRILEPSAGKGDIIERLDRRRRYGHIWAIEIDKDLRATLRGKDIKVLDTDFLKFSGPDKFDLIIANPPFDEGDKHLLKAIDIMYCGQIIFLLNAETIRNPHTRTRKELVKKLNELGAEVEYLGPAFKDAQRPTDVEVALVSIVIERKVEEDLFAGATDTAEKVRAEVHDNHELITGRRIEELVAEYNQIVTIATKTIIDFYRNTKKIGKYLKIEVEDRPYRVSCNDETLTQVLQGFANSVVQTIRTDFWRKTLDLPEVTRRLTAGKLKEFEHHVERRCEMDFTEHNIRAFVLNLINGYQATLREAIVAMFDRFTVKHCFRDVPWEQNVHYFNGWKTNSAYKVNRRIVIPVNGGYEEGPFRNWGKWDLDHRAAQDLRDIDIVMNYFDGMRPNYYTIAEALRHAFARGQNTAESSFFSKIIAYKKGTLHLTFADEDILRRFNIEACKGKGWLPESYGKDHYRLLESEHRAVVDSFEGEESYETNYGRIGLVCPPIDKTLKIEAPVKGQMGLFSKAA